MLGIVFDSEIYKSWVFKEYNLKFTKLRWPPWENLSISANTELENWSWETTLVAKERTFEMGRRMEYQVIRVGMDIHERANEKSDNE